MHNFIKNYSIDKNLSEKEKEVHSKTQKGIVTYAKKVILRETEDGYREGFYQININLNDSNESILLFFNLFDKYDDIKVGEHVNYTKKFQLLSFETYLSQLPEKEKESLLESYNGSVPETVEDIIKEDISLAREYIK